MPTAANAHVRLDDRGVAWIDDTKTKVIEVALETRSRTGGVQRRFIFSIHTFRSGRFTPRSVMSQDEDLLAEATRRQRDGIFFNGVFYAHQLGITIGRFINDLEVLALCGEPEDYVNRVEYLPL